MQTKLNTLAHLPDNLRPVLSEVGDYLVSETTQRFRDSISPKGENWQSGKVIAKQHISSA
ncbi:phage virion morphogenesis protein [Abyssogena phaseoliformis symbiont]|uniref:phage virion morphogenesis protein n=1 Tax=Abyssogena phaseoliformis symbiont TaxID=596095 RepID=UPI001CEDAE86|nr:phage virion morphogenesis protein [Abyssogena phaseoliformis symbiont]